MTTSNGSNIELLTLHFLKLFAVILSVAYQLFVFVKIVKVREAFLLKNHLLLYSLMNIVRCVIYNYINIIDILMQFKVYEFVARVMPYPRYILPYLYMTESSLNIITLMLNTYQSCRWVKIMTRSSNKVCLGILVFFGVLVIFSFVAETVIAVNEDAYNFGTAEDSNEEIPDNLKTAAYWKSFVYIMFSLFSILVPFICFYQIQFRQNTENLTVAVKRSHTVMKFTILGKALLSVVDPFMQVFHFFTENDPFNDFEDISSHAIYAIYECVPFVAAALTHYSMRLFFKRVGQINLNISSTDNNNKPTVLTRSQLTSANIRLPSARRI